MTTVLTASDLFAELESIPTIDAHEHLPPEAVHLQWPRDFYSLFEHYCAGDLVSAGATPEDMDLFENRDLELSLRWARFQPYFAAIRTSGYARAALGFVRDVLGVPDLNDDTYAVVSSKLQEINKPGLYDTILRKHCNIKACIQCWCLDEGPYPDYFHHLASSQDVTDLGSSEEVERLASNCDHAIHTLDDVLVCMTRRTEQWRSEPSVVGVKSGHAYGRSIAFRRVTRHDAEACLAEVLTGDRGSIPTYRINQLQDFLMFELLARLEAMGLPMAFHTGFQAGNFNCVADSNPLHLQTLLSAFPRARVDILHGGMPWVREVAVLAKSFPGVHLNMAWMHIINPAQARSALSEWLDMVPNTKIFGFGGDYRIVEKVYGHLKLARQNIATVLAEKIALGDMSRSEASRVAERLMFENPNAFYQLKCSRDRD